MIRRIADYRANDKHDPEYYAQHTVAKAQANLRHQQLNGGASTIPEAPHAEEGIQH